MSIIQRIQQSKHSLYTVLLLALSLLNGLYSQTYSAIPMASNNTHTTIVSYVQHPESSEHAMHETVKHGECLGSDAICKTQCAWHCQLSQALQPLPTRLNVPEQIASQLPTYQASIALTTSPELGLRPPIA